MTLYRLGLNVASTRLILLDGDAGGVIEAFGSFVVRGNYVVGTVIFLILVIINFVVITKGAGRIAEVTARFTLDAMPGKQMSIDAEMQNGVITEAQALAKRERLQKEADFYGSMDGASKFVRGDAIAWNNYNCSECCWWNSHWFFSKDMEMTQALETYTILSIGDGLVTQVPSIIVSIAAGILVTRSSEEADLGEYVTKQLIVYPRAIAIAGALLCSFLFSFMKLSGHSFILSVACFITAYFVKKKLDDPNHSGNENSSEFGHSSISPANQSHLTNPSAVPSVGAEDATALTPMESAIEQEVFGLEMGYGLLVLADKKKGGDLLDRITGARTNFAKEMGMLLPTIGVRDNIELEPNEYRFLQGKEIIRSSVVPDRFLAMSMGGGMLLS